MEMIIFGILEVFALWRLMYSDEFDIELADCLADRLKRINGEHEEREVELSFKSYSSSEEGSDDDFNLGDGDGFVGSLSDLEDEDLVYTGNVGRLENLGIEGIVNIRIG